MSVQLQQLQAEEADAREDEGFVSIDKYSHALLPLG